MVILTEMELILDEAVLLSMQQKIEEIPYTIRMPEENEYQQVYEMIFATLIKGTVGESEPSEKDYEDFLEKEMKHMELGSFAWEKGKIIGQVTATIHDDVGEILELGVLPDHWRKGIATQLLLRTFIKIYGAGGRRIRLHTDATDLYGAKSMYKKLGFRVIAEKDNGK